MVISCSVGAQKGFECQFDRMHVEMIGDGVTESEPETAILLDFGHMNSGTVEIFRIMIAAQCAMSLDIFVGLAWLW